VRALTQLPQDQDATWGGEALHRIGYALGYFGGHGTARRAAVYAVGHCEPLSSMSKGSMNDCSYDGGDALIS
jgi:hypothetical protein